MTRRSFKERFTLFESITQAIHEQVGNDIIAHIYGQGLRRFSQRKRNALYLVGTQAHYLYLSRKNSTYTLYEGYYAIYSLERRRKQGLARNGS